MENTIEIKGRSFGKNANYIKQMQEHYKKLEYEHGLMLMTLQLVQTRITRLQLETKIPIQAWEIMYGKNEVNTIVEEVKKSKQNG